MTFGGRRVQTGSQEEQKKETLVTMKDEERVGDHSKIGEQHFLSFPYRLWSLELFYMF